MFYSINGILMTTTESFAVVDCGGVGFKLSVSTNTLSHLIHYGEKVCLFTHLSVREDALELFGFATREEKNMFVKLHGVSGIGPKTALAILSTLTVRELSIALVTGDANSIARSPGVGKKTAQRLILELKDKVENEELTGSNASVKSAPLPAQSNVAGEAIEALMALGYQSNEAAAAVAKLNPLPKKVDEAIRLALKGMMK